MCLRECGNEQQDGLKDKKNKAECLGEVGGKGRKEGWGSSTEETKKAPACLPFGGKWRKSPKHENGKQGTNGACAMSRVNARRDDDSQRLQTKSQPVRLFFFFFSLTFSNSLLKITIVRWFDREKQLEIYIALGYTVN